MRSKFKKKLNFSLGLAIIFLAPLFLILVWFRKRLLLGTGESALPFYNPEFEFQWTLFAWLGRIIGVYRTASVDLPFYAFLVFLVKLGIPRFAVQAIVFFLLLVVGGASLYFLSGLFFRKEKNRKLCQLLSALIYSFNPFALVVVWNRFQYPFMFFYALMPLALFLFIKGIDKKRLIYSIYFNLVCLCLVMSFAALALLELFWLVIFSYFLFYILTNWQDKKRIFFASKFFLATFALWLLLNLWWLLQFVGIILTTEFVTAQAVIREGSIITFKIVSERLGRLLYLFRFHHKNFFEKMEEVWGPIYFSPPFLILGFLFPIFTFASLLVKEKPKLYWYFLLLSILGLFFAKGSAPPFGQLFLFIFSHFRLLEAFRNPFEKIGLILPLGFAPLFALGLTSFCFWFKKFNPKVALFLLFTVCCLLFLLYMFPLWSGWVFTSSTPPANNLEIGDYVKVPDYYQEANQWLGEDKRDFRAIALPLGGEGITHTWEYGYSGVELSNTLFDKPFISLRTAKPYLEEIALPLEDFFLENMEKFYKLMGVLNSKYIMVRSDIDYKIENMRNPTIIKEALGEGENRRNLRLVKKFGELEFYQVPDELFLPHFYVASSNYFVDENLQNPYTPLSFDEFKLKEVVFSPQRDNNLPLDLADNIYISAQPHPEEKREAIQPGVSRLLPGSKFYSFIRWKEKRLEKKIIATGDLEKIIDLNLGLANKRLGEVMRLIEREREREREEKDRNTVAKGDLNYMPEGAKLRNLEIEKLVEENWLRFRERLNKVFELLKELENQDEDVSGTVIQILDYVKLFQRRLTPLLRDEDFRSDVSLMLNSLLAVRQELEGKLWITHNELEKRYLIEVLKEGEYELFVKDTNVEYGDVRGMFKEDPFYPMSFAIDGEIATISGEKREDNWLSFGKYNLEEGRHKLEVFLPRFVNLVKQEKFTLSAKKGDYLVLPLDDFLKKGRSFNISFDYKVEGKSLPRLIVAQKVEIKGKDYVQRLIDTILPKSEYSLKFMNSFTIDPKASQAGITLFFEEYEDANLYVKNFQVTRDWRPKVVLRTTTENTERRRPIPKITFNKINPTRYEVWVEEAEEPYLLVFSESFHLGWKVYVDSGELGAEKAEVLDSYFGGEIKESKPRNDFVYKGMFDIWGKRSIPEEKHLLVNGYANSWYIRPEDFGGKESYKLIIEFWPQQLFYVGLFISGVTLFGCLGYLVGGALKFGQQEQSKQRLK